MATFEATPLHPTLRYTSNDAPNFIGTVMVPNPRIDKIAARVLLQMRNCSALQSNQFWTKNDCSPEQFAAWRDMCLCPIDLGDYKYQKAGVGSATEFIAMKFRVERTAGVARLIDLINRNNGDAYLKRMNQAVASLIIRMYEVLDDAEYHSSIVDHTSHVIECFVAVRDGKSTRSEAGLEEAVPELIEEVGSSRHLPLTIGDYVVNLWRLGYEPDEIRQDLRFWLANSDSVRQERAAGKEAYDALKPKYGFSTKGGRGIYLETDDKFLVLAARKDPVYKIRLIRSPSTGHVAISSDEANLTKVAEVLQKREPGRWYKPPGVEMQTVLNGTAQYSGVKKTDLFVHQIIGVLQQYIEAVPEKSERRKK